MGCTLYFDGACKGNPGPVAVGVVLLENGKKVAELSKRLGMGTNNIAEWRALIEGLKLAVDHGCRDLEVKGDSQLIIRQITGVYRVKSKNLLPLFNEAVKLCGHFRELKFTWVNREENIRADALSNRALSEEET